MQSTFTPGSEGARARSTADAEVAGSGWVAFAGTMLSIVGVLNIIYGLAAIDNANFYVNNAQYVFSDLNTWGWVLLIIGVVQLCAAFSIFGRTSWGRWVGILTAGLNSIAMLLFLPAYPFLALALFTVDVLVIYGLVAYGGRRMEI
jgi:phosphoglycerol transferase MdoB-like AlkP superfamily enzyme